jgi:hypothetical protein
MPCMLRPLLTYVAPGTQDPSDHEDVEPASEEVLDALNKTFNRSHAMSLHLNLVTMVALAAYGFRLASGLKVAKA